MSNRHTLNDKGCSLKVLTKNSLYLLGDCRDISRGIKSTIFCNGGTNRSAEWLLHKAVVSIGCNGFRGMFYLTNSTILLHEFLNLGGVNTPYKVSFCIHLKLVCCTNVIKALHHRIRSYTYNDGILSPYHTCTTWAVDYLLEFLTTPHRIGIYIGSITTVHLLVAHVSKAYNTTNKEQSTKCNNLSHISY